MGTLLITGGRVVDGLGNTPFNADVLVRDGRIEAVGSGLEAPPDTQRIDASGLTVMPGLIDAHCHITFDEVSSNDELFFHRREGLSAIVAATNARKVLQAGVTGIMDADSLFDLGVDLRDAIEAGIVPGPRMSTGGNALFTSVGGTAGRLVPDTGRIGYGKVLGSKAEIVQEVRRQIKIGVDWVKVHVTGLIPRQRIRGEVKVWTLDELRLVADTAHELGIPVVGHCRGADSIRDTAVAGFDMILHATYMDDEALEAVAGRGIPIVPTFTFQANLLDFGERIGASAELREIFRREIADSAVMLQRARAAGVPLLCGTESGFSITPYGDWHWRELEVFVRELGYTPLEAIRAATSDNAFSLRMAGQTGAVEAGRLADLLIIDGDVAQDITVLGDRSRIRHVFLGGSQVDLTPPPPRRDPGGWRVSHYGNAILRRDVAYGG
ncbi:MAG: amidohydrolase family protein [Pseudomonadales bacterium]|nr:amidohydrolase family protein [Pseudomonadales bacterium]MCP5182307.1 amidohydrolase family protein [Pseudomonadales bacterium]